MRFKSHEMLRAAVFSALAWVAATPDGPARAQNILSEPLRVVTPFGPGGTPDVIARLIGTGMAKRANQNVIFDNKPGAGGVVGVNYFAGLKDGMAAMMIADVGIYAITPVLRANARIDPIRDFRPIASIAKSPLFLVAGPKVPAHNLSELIAYTKSMPKLDYGTPGPGSPHHLLMEYLALQTGMKLTHVAYETSAPQLNALLTGEISIAFTGAPGVRTLTGNSKEVKVIAAIGGSRSPLMPDVPTFLEQGVAGFDGPALDVRFGVMAANGASDGLVSALNDGVHAALEEPETRARFAQLGLEPQTGSPQDFLKLMQADADYFHMVVAKTGVTLQ